MASLPYLHLRATDPPENVPRALSFYLKGDGELKSPPVIFVRHSADSVNIAFECNVPNDHELTAGSTGSFKVVCYQQEKSELDCRIVGAIKDDKEGHLDHLEVVDDVTYNPSTGCVCGEICIKKLLKADNTKVPGINKLFIPLYLQLVCMQDKRVKWFSNLSNPFVMRVNKETDDSADKCDATEIKKPSQPTPKLEDHLHKIRTNLQKLLEEGAPDEDAPAEATESTTEAEPMPSTAGRRMTVDELLNGFDELGFPEVREGVADFLVYNMERVKKGLPPERIIRDATPSNVNTASTYAGKVRKRAQREDVPTPSRKRDTSAKPPPKRSRTGVNIVTGMQRLSVSGLKSTISQIPSSSSDPVYWAAPAKAFGEAEDSRAQQKTIAQVLDESGREATTYVFTPPGIETSAEGGPFFPITTSKSSTGNLTPNLIAAGVLRVPDDLLASELFSPPPHVHVAPHSSASEVDVSRDTEGCNPTLSPALPSLPELLDASDAFNRPPSLSGGSPLGSAFAQFGMVAWSRLRLSRQ